MPYPSQPLDLRVDFQIGGQWSDVTGDVYRRDPVTFTGGRADESGQTDPGTCSMTLNNRSGRYSPRNPRSPYYGLLGRNTPVRVYLPGGPHRLDLDGSATGYAITPDAPVLDTTGDLDVRVDADINFYRDGAQTLIGKWEPTGEQRSWLMRVESGRLNFTYSIDGTAAGNTVHGADLPALPRRAVLRCTLDVNDNGSRTVRFFWSTALTGPWTEFRGANTGPGTVAVYVSTAPLRIGPPDLTSSVQRLPAEGAVYAAEVRSGIDGTLIASPDFSARPVGTASFTDTAGRAWSMNGSARIVDRQDRFVGEVAAWPARWDVSGQDVYVPIEAAGILRRYGQGRKALDSALRRRIPSGKPFAYWPMEEAREATQAYSPVPGVQPLLVSSGVEFASDDTLVSSLPLPKFSGIASIRGTVPASADTGMWLATCFFRMEAAPASTITLLDVEATGTARHLKVDVDSGGVHFRVVAASGAYLHDSYWLPNGFYGPWNRLSIAAQQAGASTSYTFRWIDVEAGGIVITHTITGTAGHVVAIGATADFGESSGEGVGTSLTFGHLAVLPSTVSVLNDADNAFRGESARERLIRLATEEDLPLVLYPGPLNPPRMGPQGSDTLLALLEEAENTDGGILHEARDRAALTYRERSTLYTQDPALTLDYTARGEVAPPLEPVSDDQAVRNDMTVVRAGGSSARAVLGEGPLSVLPPPDGIGVYDESATLSLYNDTQPTPHAAWRLHLGTYDGDRYPTVRVSLAAGPHLIPAVLGLRVGDKLRITNLPDWLPPGPLDLIIKGYQETVGPHPVWDLVLNCSPAGPWDTARTDHPVFAKADTDGSELAAAVTATATALPVRTVLGEQWVPANPVLNATPSFEGGLGTWTGFDATVATVPTPGLAPFADSDVLQVTPGGTGQYPNAGSENIPVTPGALYVLSGWLRPATARNIALNTNWFDASSGYLTTDSNERHVEAGVWSWFEATVTAPTGAATVNLSPTIPNYPPPADIVWAAHVTWRRAGGWPSEFPIDVTVGGEILRATAIGPSAHDGFVRTVTSGWASADSGQPWTTSGGTAASYSVTGGLASMAMATNTGHRTQLAITPVADVDVAVTIVPSVVAATAAYTAGPVLRQLTVNDYYHCRAVMFQTTVMGLWLTRVVSGTQTDIGFIYVGNYTAGQPWRLRARITGTVLQAKLWPAAGDEPTAWQVEGTDTAVTGPGLIGLRAYPSATNSSPKPLTVSFSDFVTADQVMTVRRSVNGITKAHPAGAPLALAHPAIASL